MAYTSNGVKQGVGAVGSGGGLTPAEQVILNNFTVNPDNDTMVSGLAIKTPLNALVLGDQHKIQSGGESVYFTTQANKTHLYPLWAGIKDQSVVANQDATGIIPPYIRAMADTLTTIEPLGLPVAGAVIWEAAILVPASAAVFSMDCIIEETLNVEDFLVYEVYLGTDATGTLIFTQFQTGFSHIVGDIVHMEFGNPVDRVLGQQLFGRMLKRTGSRSGPETPVQARRSTDDAAKPYIKFFIRTFVDEPVLAPVDMVAFVRASEHGLNEDPASFAVGTNALGSTTIGAASNTAIGFDAGASVTIGADNIFVGKSSGTNLTSGNFNLALGKDALKTATTGSSNVAIGDRTLSLVNAGGKNVAIGAVALRFHQGSSTVAIGDKALGLNTTGTNNTAIGASCLGANTGGIMNTAVGFDTLLLNTTGGMNIAMGHVALTSNITGSMNVAIGMGALKFVTASGNTGLGHLAMGAGLVAGVDNTAIGKNAGSSVINGSRNIFIGAGTSFAADLSDMLNIGNIIHANMAAGMVGIGTTDPKGCLEVVGPQSGNVGGFAAGELQVRSDSTNANAGAVITGHNSFAGNTQVWYFGSVASANDDIGLINRTVNGSLGFWTNNTLRVSIPAAGGLDIGGQTGALIIPRMTTTQRNALAAIDGMMIYNTSIDTFNVRKGGTWTALQTA